MRLECEEKVPIELLRPGTVAAAKDGGASLSHPKKWACVLKQFENHDAFEIVYEWHIDATRPSQKSLSNSDLNNFFVWNFFPLSFDPHFLVFFCTSLGKQP